MKPILTALILAGLVMSAGCGGPARPVPERQRRIAVQYHAGVLREKVTNIIILPFDISNAPGGDGLALQQEYRRRAGDLGYSVRQDDAINALVAAPSFAMNPALKEQIMAAAKAAGHEAVLFGQAIIKPQVSAHALTLFSTASGRVLWTVLAENASSADIIIRLKQEMAKAGSH